MCVSQMVSFVLQIFKPLQTSCSDKISVFTKSSVCNCLLLNLQAGRNCSCHSLSFLHPTLTRWKEVLHLHLSGPYCGGLLGARGLLFLAFPRQGRLMASGGWGEEEGVGPLTHFYTECSMVPC